MLAKCEPALGYAAPATARTVFENVTFDARWHDAQAEALYVIIEANEGLCTGLSASTVRFVILAIVTIHVATVSPPQKQVAKAYSNIIWYSQKYCREKIRLPATKSKLGNSRLRDF